MTMFIVRVIWEGELLSRTEFDSEILATAYYKSTIDFWNRSDDSAGISVMLLDEEIDDILFEHYFPEVY